MEYKIKVIFMGQIRRKLYKFDNERYGNRDYFRKPEIRDDYDILETKKFYECEIERPPFKVNEDVYINDLDIRVVITNCMRSTNGEYVYLTNHVIELIDDELSAESKEKTDKDLAEELIRYNLWEEIENKHKNKRWYEFWL